MFQKDQSSCCVNIELWRYGRQNKDREPFGWPMDAMDAKETIDGTRRVTEETVKQAQILGTF